MRRWTHEKLINVESITAHDISFKFYIVECNIKTPKIRISDTSVVQSPSVPNRTGKCVDFEFPNLSKWIKEKLNVIFLYFCFSLLSRFMSRHCFIERENWARISMLNWLLYLRFFQSFSYGFIFVLYWKNLVFNQIVYSMTLFSFIFNNVCANLIKKIWNLKSSCEIWLIYLRNKSLFSSE